MQRKNRLPKINFVYSLPYNRLFSKEDERKIFEEVKSFINKLELKWGDIGEKVLKTIEEVGFPWKVKCIDCYVVKDFPISGISIPLTIKVFDDIEFAIYILIHELIHINFLEEKEYVNILNLLRLKFREEPIIIRHIVVCSAVKRVVTNLFGKEFFRRMHKIESKFKYRKALEIVEEIYPKLKEENIIESFKEYLK